MPNAPKRMGRRPTYGDRRNVTMALPIKLVRTVDELAQTDGGTRTEFIIEAIIEKCIREKGGTWSLEQEASA